MTKNNEFIFLLQVKICYAWTYALIQWLRPWRLCTPRCAQSLSLRHPGQAMTTVVAWWKLWDWVIPLDLLHMLSTPHGAPHHKCGECGAVQAVQLAGWRRKEG